MRESQHKLAILMLVITSLVFWYIPVIVQSVENMNVVRTLNWLGDGFLLLGIICCWNFFNGSLGTIDLGYTTYFGVGAYFTAIAVTQFGLPFIPSVAIGVLSSVIYAVIVGAFILRLDGIYFSIATFSLLIGTRSLMLAFRGITNGGIGLGVQISYNAFTFYYASATLLIIIIITIWCISRTSFRSMLVAIRHDSILASVRGLPALKYKQMTYCISAFFMGLIGGLWIYRHPTIDPNTVFIETDNFIVVSSAIIGGYDSVIGSLIGGILTYALQSELNIEWALVVNALVLIVCVRYLRGGIVSIWRSPRTQFNWFQKIITSQGKKHGYSNE